MHLDDRLRERMDWGGPESGMTINGFLDEWTKSTQDRHYIPRVGDSSSEAAERFLSLLDELGNSENVETLLLVTHGGITTDLLRTLFGDEEISRLKPHLIDYGIPGCAVTHLRNFGTAYELVALADLEHLQESLRSDHKRA